MTQSVTAPRPIRSVDLDARDLSPVRDGIADLYADRIDVIMIRGAFSRDSIAGVGAELDRNDRDPGWANPNARIPTEDIQVIGTAATRKRFQPTRMPPSKRMYISATVRISSTASGGGG
jgi:hypothetical protein